uniref:Uncharacterized protein n=1 Tax=Anguilla anguilla TaxID=7936 RepID=A0A0E9PC63_ANGAN
MFLSPQQLRNTRLKPGPEQKFCIHCKNIFLIYVILGNVLQNHRPFAPHRCVPIVVKYIYF